MKRSNKKGFTTVELVIVIAVIAILAAVLIPTFANLVEKANQSADIQATRQMNVVLAAESVDAKPAGIKEVIEILDEADFNVNSLTPVTKDHVFKWCPVDNVILLIDTEKDAVIFPDEKNTMTSYAAHKADLVDLMEGKFYINVDASTSEEAQEALNAGSDLSLKEDVAITETVQIKNDTTLDLNGNDLDASANTSRPFELSEGATLTINAEGSTIKCGLYGLVNIPAGTSGTIVINGGNFVAETDNGAFLKLRSGGGNLNIVLNDVTYTDNSGNGYILNSKGFEGNLTLTVNGGSYTADGGFQCGDGNTKFDGVTINTKSVSITCHAGKAEIVNCKITTGNKTDSSAPAAAVATSGNGVATVSKCTINVARAAFSVYSSGGSITATNNTIIGTVAEGTEYGTIIVNGVKQ